MLVNASMRNHANYSNHPPESIFSWLSELLVRNKPKSLDGHVDGMFFFFKTRGRYLKQKQSIVAIVANIWLLLEDSFCMVWMGCMLKLGSYCSFSPIIGGAFTYISKEENESAIGIRGSLLSMAVFALSLRTHPSDSFSTIYGYVSSAKNDLRPLRLTEVVSVHLLLLKH